MPKIRLRDDPDGALHARLRLDDESDVQLLPVDVLPRMVVYERSLIGENDDGDRHYRWTARAEVPVVAFGQLSSDTLNGVVTEKVKITALDDGSSIDSKVAFTLEWGDVTEPTAVDFWRVSRVEQNGLRVEIDAERVRDA